VAIAAGELPAARDYLEQVHRGTLWSSFLWGQIFVLEAAAFLAAADGDWERVALLLGAAEAARERLLVPLTASYYAGFTRQFSPLWTLLLPGRREQLWSLGRRHTLEQAMAAVGGAQIPAAELLPAETAGPSPEQD